jgi:ArsR family transcriptional regulator, arsenate/arsenite/antimonite-responsive transcriptional repressor
VDVREDQLRLIADATRLRIVRFLAAPVQSCCVRDDGVCACDLESHLGLSQPTVSHHMRLLEGAGLVRAERRGRWVYYELETGALRALAAGLAALADEAEANGRPSVAASAAGGTVTSGTDGSGGSAVAGFARAVSTRP